MSGFVFGRGVNIIINNTNNGGGGGTSSGGNKLLTSNRVLGGLTKDVYEIAKASLVIDQYSYHFHIYNQDEDVSRNFTIALSYKDGDLSDSVYGAGGDSIDYEVNMIENKSENKVYFRFTNREIYPLDVVVYTN